MIGKANAMALIGALAGMRVGFGPPIHEKEPKRKQICCNPACKKEHTTGKSYCSVECCKEHRRLS